MTKCLHFAQNLTLKSYTGFHGSHLSKVCFLQILAQNLYCSISRKPFFLLFGQAQCNTIYTYGHTNHSCSNLIQMGYVLISCFCPFVYNTSKQVCLDQASTRPKADVLLFSKLYAKSLELVEKKLLPSKKNGNKSKKQQNFFATDIFNIHVHVVLH